MCFLKIISLIIALFFFLTCVLAAYLCPLETNPSSEDRGDVLSTLTTPSIALSVFKHGTLAPHCPLSLREALLSPPAHFRHWRMWVWKWDICKRKGGQQCCGGVAGGRVGGVGGGGGWGRRKERKRTHFISSLGARKSHSKFKLHFRFAAEYFIVLSLSLSFSVSFFLTRTNRKRGDEDGRRKRC